MTRHYIAGRIPLGDAVQQDLSMVVLGALGAVLIVLLITHLTRTK